MKPFPIPVTMIGPGSQPEDETLDYLTMPQGMQTYRAPRLPEPEALAPGPAAVAALRTALAALGDVQRDGEPRSVPLGGLAAADLALLNQVLGEGEVAARVQADGDDGLEARVQESVFAGLWRVIRSGPAGVLSDAIEVGAIPPLLRRAAEADVRPAPPAWPGALPPGVQNAPLLLAEIEDACARWRPGDAPHVVNLTLLPMSNEDIGFLDHHLGTGRVLILSRGYGNCRITNTRRLNVWRVVYYNSQDVVILNTVEVSALPEVALAAAEDLADSTERLGEVLAWVEGGEG